MFKNTYLIIFTSIAISISAQQNQIDSLRKIIADAPTDTAKIIPYEKLGDAYYLERKMDSCVWAFQRALEINKRNNYSLQRQCWNMAAIDYRLYEMANYTESLKYASDLLKLSERLNDTGQTAMVHLVFGQNYREMGEYRQSLDHFFKGYELFEMLHKGRHEPPSNTFTILCISQVYLKMGKLDSALIYAQRGYKLAADAHDGGVYILAERILGDISVAKGDNETALYYYRRYIPEFVEYEEKNRDLGFVLNSIAGIFQKKGQKDSVIYYAKKALGNAIEYKDQENIYRAANALYDSYKDQDDREAFTYFKIASAAKDSMISLEKTKQVQVLTFNEQTREKLQREAEAKQAARVRLIFIAAAVLISIISFLIWNRIRQLRMKYKMILEQKESERLKVEYNLHKAQMERQIIELESKALRAQMNPHFIFNCMNSIKSLMQEREIDKGVTYLTTFSKLIRTLFNNADKKEISLHDEIETCKLYLQLEAMRFDSKFSYSVVVGPGIDLKSVQVPALIIQPFIENAIWHGIAPRDSRGHISLDVLKQNGTLNIVIEDDGIGRESSYHNKANSGLVHQSKGVNLTQSRLELDALLKQRRARLEIIDKQDEAGIAKGTKVIIKINEEMDNGG